MSLDNTYDELVVTRAPIYNANPLIQPVTTTLYSSSSTPRTLSTSVLYHIATVPLVVTLTPIEIEK